MGKVDQKNKRGDIYKITDAVIHLYLVYMFVIFPLVLHDGYKDITITKYNFFKNGVLALLIIMALLLVLYLTDRSGNTGHPGSDRAASKKHTILASDVFMVLFLIAGFFAFLAAKKMWFCIFASRRSSLYLRGSRMQRERMDLSGICLCEWTYISDEYSAASGD